MNIHSWLIYLSLVIVATGTSSRHVKSVANSVVVMADGEKVASGTPDEIRNDPLVHAIYLGEQGAA